MIHMSSYNPKVTIFRGCATFRPVAFKKNQRWQPTPWISMEIIECCCNPFHQIPLVTRIQKIFSLTYLGRTVKMKKGLKCQRSFSGYHGNQSCLLPGKTILSFTPKCIQMLFEIREELKEILIYFHGHMLLWYEIHKSGIDTKILLFIR